MHVVVDLGFRSLVVVAVSFLVPVIGFLFGRHKWRAAAARNEDIKRLLILAAEEAARAELEVTAGYGVVSASQKSGYGVASGTERWKSRGGSYCAVCYSPTTNRCARCKSVRYCSAKCQIDHWRQGHKDNCHPPHIVDENIDEEDYGGPQLTQENVEIKTDQLEVRRSTEKFSEEPTITNAGCPPEILCLSDDDSDDEFLDRKEANSPSGSSATSFSGFSSTTNSSGSSDDVSVSESVSSFEPERSDGHQSVNDSLDILQTSFNVDQIDQAKPLSPKFASLVESVDGFAKVSKSNQVKPSCKDEENVRISVSPSGFNHNATSEGPVTEPCTVSSDFWGRTLDYVGSEIDAHPSNSGLANNNKTSHSSDDAFPDSSGLIKSVHGDDTSEKITGDLKKVNNSPSLSFQGSNDAETGSTSVSHPFQTREIKSVPPLSSNAQKNVSERASKGTDALHSSRVVPTSSERSNHFVNNCGRTVNFMEAGCPSSSGSDARPASSVRGSSVPIVVSSQGTNSSNDRNGSKTSVFKVFDHFRGPKVSKNYPMGVGSEIAGKYTEKELFPYEVFVKLYNWNKVELQPSGLINCGNSCYANAVLQCLAFTPPLTAYLLQGLHSGGCAKKEWCFMCEFESLIGKAKEGKSPLSPIGILSQLRKVGSQLGNGREEDAHEFLRYAIDTMQSVCLMEAGVNVSNPSKEETTLMGLTFGGYLRSKIKCTRCQGKSERQERMMDLTVEIEGDIGTLEEALRRFTGTEILDGENKYQCSRCKSYEKAKKKLTILEAPNILTIALKRFQSGKFGKINKPIRFPEILDLAPYMSGTSDKSPIYKLFGVVVHLDVMNAAFSGHYVCYVKNFQNKWFKIDDSTVTTVELDKVLTNRAYMLLYSRCSARAPRLIRNRLLSYDPKYRAIPSWISGKTSSVKSKSLSTHPSVAQHCSSNPQGNSTSSPPLQRISKDSSSDNSSLLSSRSEEGSCSTDSTRYSTSTDDLSDYIFGDSGHGWNSPWRNCSDSDTSSSSSSPSSSRHSPLSESNRYASSSETMGLWDSRPVGDSLRSVDSDGKVSNPFLDSDTIEQCRKLASSSSRYRETDSQRLVLDSVSDVKCRKSTWGRTVNI